MTVAFRSGWEMKRCLFVDDSAVIRKVAKRILTAPDMAVIEASNGEEAIDACVRSMPDYIVIDTSLQDVSAEDLIRHIRTLPAGNVPRIAICTIEMDVPTIMRAKRAGAQGFLLKPFNRAQLLDQFRTIRIAA
jgi:two-component system, chemotaxis family, chemotaxis protein CheY